MKLLDALLYVPKHHWAKISKDSFQIVCGRLDNLRLDSIGLPDQVAAEHGNNRKLEGELRTILGYYYSSCLLFLEEFLLRPSAPLFNYESRIGYLGASSVIDLASSCHMYDILTYDYYVFQDPSQSPTGFLVAGASFAYGKTRDYVSRWWMARFNDRDPVTRLNELFCVDFASVLGVSQFNNLEQSHLISMAGALGDYARNLSASVLGKTEEPSQDS